MAEGGEAVPGSLALRIFVGGLGAAVTAADLEDRFSSLGKVRGTELVRSGCRSFAYIDFEPNSDKALAKLFAVYNGCTWKGGRLRLEKAKEHYTSRLKREWIEDTRENTPVDIDNKGSAGHLKNSEQLDQEKRHIHIFFPKLGKVKALPMKGTGKHKYSFQRIEVPALPIHFCDCEEHYDASETAGEKYTLALNTVAYEKERSIINNVMERLLGKEHDEIPEPERRSPSACAKDIDDNDIDNMTKGTQSEDEDGDMDNIVTNIGVGQSDEILMQLIGTKKHLVDEVQESRINMSELHKNKLSQKKTHPVKKQKTEVSITTEVNLNQATFPMQDGPIGEDEFFPASTKDLSSEGMEDREVSPDKNPAENISDSVKSVTSNSWMQKSSWKQLVGESGSRSFSFSHVFASTNTMVSDPLNAKDHSIMSSLTRKKRKRSVGESSTPLEAEDKKTNTKNVVQVSITPEITSNQAVSPSPDDKIIEIESSAKQDSEDMDEGGNFTEAVQVSITPEITSNQAVSPSPDDKIIEIESSAKQDSEDMDEGGNFTEASNITNTVKSAVTNTWVQKSSWKELVGESGNSSFSLSQIISGMNVAAPKPLNTKVSVTTSTMEKKNRSSTSDGEGLIPAATEKVSEPERTVKPLTVDVVKTSVEHDNDQDMTTKKQEPRNVPKINIGEVCTFMRSAESEKQWLKAKTALGGYLKRKSRDNSASKEPNGGARRRQ